MKELFLQHVYSLFNMQKTRPYTAGLSILKTINLAIAFSGKDYRRLTSIYTPVLCLVRR